MHRKILLLVLISLFMIVVGTTSLSMVSAESALQQGPATATPLATDGTETPLPNLSAVAPVATQEIDPESLIFEDGWQFPSNLSKSGATSEPQFVIDSNGLGHILWSDEVSGFVYTVGSGDEWSKPETSEFPFFTRRFYPDLRDGSTTPGFKPLLVADESGQIFAFWIGDAGVLYFSSVPASNFTDYDSWTPRVSLASRARTLDVVTGPDGRLHLVYVRPSESATRPAGVYYQQLNPSGAWTDPIVLYASRYLRSVPADVANIQVVAPNSGNVYVVWDDTLKEQIFFTGSNNNGLNWDSPQEIDRRTSEDEGNATGPANIVLGTNDEQLHLTWNAGHESGRECSQYVSTSNDGGTTWTYREALASLPACFAATQFVIADETLFLLGTTEREGSERGTVISTSYLLAWDGNRWSKPQIQETLANFSNPETNQAVRLQCHKALGRGSEITLIGCDSAKGGDIWLIGREAGETDEWFPPPPVWKGPDEVNSGVSQPSETRLVSSSDGLVHAFWNEDNSPRVYRANWDGESWTSGQEIITSPGGNVEALAAASAAGRLFLTWEDTAKGLQFSTASISSPSQWTDPVSVVDEQLAARSPSILADDGGNVFLAFAVKLNEARGIYLIHSADAGETWSSPIQVFDGPDAGWDMVDKPILTRTENGQMHLMWTRHTLPPDSVPLGFAYSRTEDLGQTWTEVETVVEARSYWNELIGAGERSLHSLWSEVNGARQVIWHRYSLDGGLTWSQSEQVIGLNSSGALSMAVDPVHRPHLLSLDNGQLGDLVWEDGQWIEGAGLKSPLDQGGYLDAASNQIGQLIVAYAGNLSGENSAEKGSRLFGMWRLLDLPEELPAPLPTLTPTRPALTPTPPATPQPTPTVFFPTQREQSGLGEIPGMSGLPISMDLVASLIPVLLIVGLGIIIGLRIIRKR